jgi:two-component system chemotaxis sensor kinase CheA
LVIDVDGCRFGIVVDTVHDTEEIVVKPLGRQLNGVPIYAGASILGDGQIALIIDPVILAREANIDQHRAELSTESSRNGDSLGSNTAEQLLIVQVSSELRAAVPLSHVKRLEEFRRGDIERLGSCAMIQYRGGILPLLDVGAALKVSTEPLSSGQVVVVALGDSALGLQVDQILDVSSELTALKPVQGQPGISAFGVIHGRVVALLDLEHLWKQSLGGVAATSYSEQV